MADSSSSNEPIPSTDGVQENVNNSNENAIEQPEDVGTANSSVIGTSESEPVGNEGEFKSNVVTENNQSEMVMEEKTKQKTKEKRSVRFALEGEEDQNASQNGPESSESQDNVDIPLPPAEAVQRVSNGQEQHAEPSAPAISSGGVQQVNTSFESFTEQAPSLTPADHAKLLRERVDRDSRDGDAWLGLIEDAAARADLDALRKTYEEFFVIFPNAARQWQDYASVELSHSEFANVENIFTRCLRTTPSTDLWQFYLSYTRRVNPLPPSAGAQKAANGAESDREKVRKVIEGAYEFALRFIGQSRDSGEVWRDYINLLKERETSNQWQAGQKMDDIRRAYQRAVAVPLAIVEQIWREYDAYENGLNRITAKKFLADRSPAYMTARSVFREMRTLTDSLYRPQLPRVPCWATPPSLEAVVSPLTVVRDRHNIELWKKYLKWEESNPLQLEDVQALQTRVILAYRKSVMHMRFYPELWYMASIYLQKCEREEEAVTWLRNGMEACAGSSLLSFAFIEQAERHSQTQGCNEIFEQLLNWIHTEIDKLNEHLDVKIKTIEAEAERQKAEVAARKRDEGAADAIEGEEREELRKMEERREERRIAERERVRPRIEEMKEYASLVWIKHMHFARRTEGQKPSRTIFARARKSKYCTWQIFEANALMEYHTNKDVVVATKVFELALKTYGSDEAFVVRYLDFLLAINDDNNARALFERTVGNFTPDRARPIWDRWSQYEYSFGDSASIAKIEERLSQVYPEENATKRLMNRNTYMDLDIVGPRDLGVRTLAASAGGGASAAERATIASRELAQEMEGNSVIGAPTGPRMDTLQSIAEEPMMKRPRLNSTTPPPSTHYRGGVVGGAAPSGPRGVKRSVSPPSRYVPPPRGEPGIQSPQLQHPNNAQHQQQQQQSHYLELPDGVMYLLNTLPNASFFDGPVFPAESIIDSLLNANVPAATDFFAKQQRNGPAQNAGGRGGRRGGFGRGGRRF
ncbi:hypothetical protein L7F22_042046 [Adiantum nelumboides]|nr:hypothetical protein [Adiantum nelumboides]